MYLLNIEISTLKQSIPFPLIIILNNKYVLLDIPYLNRTDKPEEMITSVENKCEELLTWSDDPVIPYSAVHKATMLNSVTEVEQLLHAGQDINEPDGSKQTPLHWASIYCSEVHEFLLQTGGTKLNAQDDYGNTPLILAARHARDDTVTLLLNDGANPLQTNFSMQSPIDVAKIYNNPTTVVILEKL